MLVELGLFLAGLALLLYGANTVVTEAGQLALFYGVSTFFVGVTVISIGTSIPEMTTSLYAASYGAGDLVVGNIIGSEIAQITLAIGVVATVSPIITKRSNVVIYGGGMLLAMIIMILTLEDGRIGRSEGVLMMLAYVIFIHDLYTSEGGEEIAEEVIEDLEPPRRTVPWIVIGLVMVVVGGQLLVTNGVALARIAGIGEYLVGLLTGLGTTLPEIVVAGLAAKRGDTGTSIGSLLGSNITDPVFSLGIGALVADVVVTDLAAVQLSATYMVGVSVVVLGLLYWKRGLRRRWAVVPLALYFPSYLVL